MFAGPGCGTPALNRTGNAFCRADKSCCSVSLSHNDKPQNQVFAGKKSACDQVARRVKRIGQRDAGRQPDGGVNPGKRSTCQARCLHSPGGRPQRSSAVEPAKQTVSMRCSLLLVVELDQARLLRNLSVPDSPSPRSLNKGGCGSRQVYCPPQAGSEIVSSSNCSSTKVFCCKSGIVRTALIGAASPKSMLYSLKPAALARASYPAMTLCSPRGWPARYRCGSWHRGRAAYNHPAGLLSRHRRWKARGKARPFAFFRSWRGSVRMRCMNWLPPNQRHTVHRQLVGGEKSFEARRSGPASFVITPLIRQPSGSSVWAAATTRPLPVVRLPI